MNPYLALGVTLLYFLVIITISMVSSRKSTAADFYRGGNRSLWWVVALGMIGTSLSGVTFISVPGWVSSEAKMTYFAVVLGNFIGYIIIAHILLPLYYKLNLTSIYAFLEKRFGFYSYKTSASLFLLSKIIGASFRLFIVTLVLQITIFDPLHIPFSLNVCFCVFIIWVYTFRGGIKSIVWTDLIQTFFLIFAVIFTIFQIQQSLGLSFAGMVSEIAGSSRAVIFDFSNFWNNPNNFFKQFIAGIFIAIVMTGLDQDMMQKNLSLKNIKEAKKNFLSFSVISIPVIFIFLCLGVLFYIYMEQTGIPIPEKTDEIYPILATRYLSVATGIFFILGVTAAAFSSANSALIALTTSFTVDILNIRKYPEKRQNRIRFYSHLMNAVIIAAVIILFHTFNNQSVVSAIFKFAGYTYGPLLGMFFTGIFLKISPKDKAVPYIAIISIIVTVILDKYSAYILNGYQFGFEILLVNGFLTTVGLMLFKNHKSLITLKQ